ncbi:MAG: nucleotide sugar dehydrogenase [Patescibacteria group bacterium]
MRTRTLPTDDSLIANRAQPQAKTLTPTVAVVGLGYVGLPLAIQAKVKGFLVRGYDVSEKRTKEVMRGAPDFLTDEERTKLSQKRFDASSDESILDGASIYVICVPTPVHENGEPDLAPLISASEAVGRHMKRGCMVIVESTVSPGVCEEVSLAILEKLSGLKGEQDFAFAHCPERINPGDTKWDVRSIPRVLGALGPKSLARAKQFYESVIEGSVHPMGSIKEAEAVKMVENAFRDVNIAFVNELAMSFTRAGIDLSNVLGGAGTKPFGFVPFAPGCGVGGHCIPVDPYYLIRYGRENGFEHRFLVAAREINSGMPEYTVGLLEEELGGTLRGAEVALLGLSYKRGIPDLRESPALFIREELRKRGASVRSYDPYVSHGSTVDSLEEALDGADAVIIATDHEEFCKLTPESFTDYGIDIVIDGRNCLDKEEFVDAGITYRGIGR